MQRSEISWPCCCCRDHSAGASSRRATLMIEGRLHRCTRCSDSLLNRSHTAPNSRSRMRAPIILSYLSLTPEHLRRARYPSPSKYLGPTIFQRRREEIGELPSGFCQLNNVLHV